MAADCIFCRIISGGVPADIVYTNEHVIAFKDISPKAPTHLLIIPREHVDAVADIDAGKRAEILARIFDGIAHIVRESGLQRTGYRVCLNQGADAGQVVPHLHFHLLSGRKLNWPPG